MHKPYPIVIRSKIQETKDAVSLILDIPEDLKSDFSYKAGQYVTIERIFDNHTTRRSYSICSSPHEQEVKISIKHVPNGLMSTWLVQEVQPGQVIHVIPPEGRFTTVFDGSRRQHHYFIAAGSGITPIMSLLKLGLEEEPMSEFTLLYGSRSEDNILFKSELDDLLNSYGEQLRIYHSISSNVKSNSLLGRLFGSAETSDRPLSGRINESAWRHVIKNRPPSTYSNHIYLCGPGDMIKNMESWLKSAPLHEMKIHKEYFTNPDQKENQISHSGGAILTYKNLNGQSGQISIDKSKTILASLMDEGIDAPYSCMNGVCSSCMAKLIRGEVHMDTNLALDEDEVEAGYILTCQSHPTTGEIEVEFDN